MKILFNNRLAKPGTIRMLVFAIMSLLLIPSCNKDELEIQQDYPFEVKVMPVPKEITNGQTVEIRITIQRRGKFKDTRYYLRYFQFDGQGLLRCHNDPPYLPNDVYPLPSEQFRLYYTSRSAAATSFNIWITDNFGNEKQVSFQFNSKD
jgi:hypothetical protein